MKKLLLITILYILTSCDNNNVQMSKDTYEQLIANQKEDSKTIKKQPIINDEKRQRWDCNNRIEIVYDPLNKIEL